jgi:predicted nucleic acid-binding protein
MAFVVLYDACALHGNTSRDLLIRIAQAGLVQAKWSEQILDELVRSLKERGIGTSDKLVRLRRLIVEAVADSMVTGHEKLIESLKLPDPDDRHVLAAAIRCHAQIIVTDNTRDFPASALEPWNVEAK